MLLPDGIAALDGARQEQDRLLDVRGQVEQVHDLRDAEKNRDREYVPGMIFDATLYLGNVVEFSKAEFLERAKAESEESSLGAVGEQYNREFLPVGALLKYGNSPVQVFTENGSGAGGTLRRKGLLSEVDTTTDSDCNRIP
jgi:hypothetical protein